MTATPAWLAAIEALLERGITGSARAAGLAKRLEGTAILIEIQDIAAVRAGITNGRISLIAADDAINTADTADTSRSGTAAPDAVISGSPFALLSLARGAARDPGTSAAVRVSGDAEVANSYRQLFASARPDLEEELSRVVGDLPARRLSQLAAQTLAWARKARRTAGENVTEYLQEESRDLVNKPELREFLQDVDSLREMADRVEARLARLEQQLKSPPS